MVSRQARNARAGIEIERKAQQQLEAAGYTVVRSAGSHGPFDLVTVWPDSLAIQIKRTSADRSWLPVLRELYAQPVAAGVTKQLWVWLKGEGWLHKITVLAEEAA